MRHQAGCAAGAGAEAAGGTVMALVGGGNFGAAGRIGGPGAGAGGARLGVIVGATGVGATGVGVVGAGVGCGDGVITGCTTLGAWAIAPWTLAIPRTIDSNSRFVMPPLPRQITRFRQADRPDFLRVSAS
jgi:hypothetical protein